ncbi:MAG: DUF222 domain-containing protein [Actinobacteria bacterium]|nr:DUF222 domain-containing protein [Actinomycetota bacterium]
MEEDPLHRLEVALDGLAHVSVEALPDAALDELVVRLGQAERRLAAEQARVVGEWEARGVWAADGSRTAAAKLSRATGRSSKAAAAQCRRAAALREMPVVAEAFRDGRLGADHVDALIHARDGELAEVFARDEAVLVGHAETLGYPEFARALRYWKLLADDTKAERDAGAPSAARRLHVSATFSGLVELDGTLDPIGGEIVRNELERIERALFRADWEDAKATHGEAVSVHHLSRTSRQRRADALVEMAKGSAAARSTGATAPPPLITVLVSHDEFRDRVCETARGTVVAPGLISDLLFDAEVERVVFGPGNRPLEVGRRTRFFTGALRRAIQVRDRYCSHPTCTVPADDCEIDHIVSYDEGGETTLDNGRLLCGPHNRWAYRQRSRQRPADRGTAGGRRTAPSAATGSATGSATESVARAGPARAGPAEAGPAEAGPAEAGPAGRDPP